MADKKIIAGKILTRNMSGRQLTKGSTAPISDVQRLDSRCGGNSLGFRPLRDEVSHGVRSDVRAPKIHGAVLKKN